MSSVTPAIDPLGGDRAAAVDGHLNTLWQLLRNGCAWRALPLEFGPWCGAAHHRITAPAIAAAAAMTSAGGASNARAPAPVRVSAAPPCLSRQTGQSPASAPPPAAGGAPHSGQRESADGC
ncbi:MAG: hypothetical protein EOP86_00825 [Verrucomicrobiaceae bacterium]|nr:MAG: hypothetical protein EOP86_00825 [Verrucomicrobiaceae bacterium]